MYPRMIIDLSKLKHNAKKLCEMATDVGITDLAFEQSFFALTKNGALTQS